MSNKLRVVAYARVSTNTKDQENSFENQKNYFEREIAKNPEWELVEIYADKGLTGTTINKRKEFLRMIYDAGIDIKEHKGEQVYIVSDRKPKFDLILVKNTSRFARNINVVELLRKLRQKGVYVNFLDIGKSTQNEADFVFIEMLMVFDENESRDKSRKVRFGHMEGALKGVLMTNSRLYGYRRIDKFTLEVIPEEAEMIKFIFEKYAEGYGMRQLVKLLDEKGYKTREGKSFNVNTIKKILSNPIYMGHVVRNRYTTGTIFVDKSSPKLLPKEKWIIHKHRVPPIISEELFYKCEQIRKGRVSIYNSGKNTGTSLFAGKIFCGKCGSPYHHNVDKGRPFYNCSLKKKKGTQACDNPNISEERLIELVEEQVKDMLLLLNRKKTKIKELVSEIINVLQDKINSNDLEDKFDNEELDLLDLEELKNKENKEKLLLELENITLKEKKLLDLYLDGGISKEIFERKKKELENERSIIENKINQEEYVKRMYENRINLLKKYIEWLDENLPNNTENINIKDYLDFIQRIIVYNKDNIDVKFSWELNFDTKTLLEFANNIGYNSIELGL
ncbi:recombinase family protein [Caldanaerobacter subterraneus]|uniref:Recombinase family protein n=1 Tax=Caldanaerobacter subterraneus TaxID=911092 RepID=A0A7Y2L6H0_9THEO|nr:recombinase family protein [Caldanaerobacter subterraneus]NNG66127.1 recombinase family protein [Caldanaerobacter subterraneus]